MRPFVRRELLFRKSYVGVLDSYSGAAAAWSIRKLSAAYSGYAINVRRSSDNATQDIGFDGTGYLDTTALLSFVGAGNGFVTKWYDQSGNRLDRAQASSGAQPLIVNSGSLVTLNGKAAVDFTGGTASMTAGTTSSFNYLHNGTKSFVSLVQNENGAASERFINTGGSSTAQVGFLLRSAATNGIGCTVANGSSGNSSIGTSQTSITGLGSFRQFILGLVLDASNATAANRASLYINGSDNQFSNSSTTAPSMSNAAQAMGAPDSSTTYTGKMQEMIFWNTDQTNNRTGIRDNQKSYYGTY
jgi:hypothetical protein